MKHPAPDLRAALRALPAEREADITRGLRSVEASRAPYLLSPQERQRRIENAAAHTAMQESLDA